MWHLRYRLLHVLLQVAQTKAENDIVGESLKDDDIIETKDAKDNKSKESVCNICVKQKLELL